MKILPNRIRFRALIAALVIVAFLILLIVLPLLLPSGPRVVAHAVSPDGVSMYVVQQPHWGNNWANLRGMFDDPWFTTRFICRAADGGWKSYYYSHEDTYWLRRGRFVLETNESRAVVYRGKDAVIRFHWDTGAYQITRPYADGTARDDVGRQPEDVPAGWMPHLIKRQQ